MISVLAQPADHCFVFGTGDTVRGRVHESQLARLGLIEYETIQCMTTHLDPGPRDRSDALAEFGDRFWHAPDIIAYLDGNSLGRLPISTRTALHHVVDQEWGRRLIRSWSEGWAELPVDIGDELAAAALGARPGQTVIADSTSVNIYKVLRVAASMRPDRDELVIDSTAFPTDRYLVDSVAAERGMRVRVIDADPVHGIDVDALAAVLGNRSAAVLLGHVDYRSGALLDMPELTARIHRAGAMAVWDLSHSVGVVPLELDSSGVDFAVGCTYKYLNAGPGAPAFIYVAERHLPAIHQPIPGWWSAADLFAMEETHRPAGGIRRMLSGTPPVLALTAVREGIALTAEAGLPAIRAKSVELGSYLIDLLEAKISHVRIASPRTAHRRGGHVTVAVDDAASATQQLIARGILPDLRHPDLIRLGLSPLSTSFAEVAAAVDVMADVLR